MAELELRSDSTLWPPVLQSSPQHLQIHSQSCQQQQKGGQDGDSEVLQRRRQVLISTQWIQSTLLLILLEH